MTDKPRSEILIETHRRLVINHRGRVRQMWCAACERQAMMVGVEEAAVVAGLSAREIYQQVEAGRLHFTETVEGWLLICLNCLPGTSLADSSEEHDA